MIPYRTLFSLPRYWPAVGGSELHTRTLAHQLSPYADVIVLCHNSDPQRSNERASAAARSRRCDDNGIAVHQVAPQGARRQLLAKLAFLHPHARLVRPLFDHLFAPVSYRALWALSEDRELIHAVYNGMTVMAEQALAVARARDIPFVFTPLAHTHAPEGQGWSSPRFLRLYREADALIAMTDYEREWLIAHGAQPTRTHVCPVGPLVADQVDPLSFRLAHGIGQAPLVLFLGRHVATKGYRALAQAASGIWARHPEARLLFVGPQTKDSRLLFEQLNDPRLLVIDRISDADKCSALAACDLLCVPSTQESLGVIYLEAWHYAKPVVAANIDVMRSVIRHGEDGLLVAPQPNPIANAVNALLDAPELAAEMGQSGQQRMRHHYSWPVLASRVAELYGNLLGRPFLQQVAQS